MKIYRVTQFTVFSALLVGCVGDVSRDDPVVVDTDPGTAAEADDAGLAGATDAGPSSEAPAEPEPTEPEPTEPEPTEPEPTEPEPTEPEPTEPEPTEPEPTEPEPTEPEPVAEACDLVPNLQLSEVSIYQAVKIPLMDGGRAVPAGQRQAPVVAGKQALIRLFVQPLSGFSAREVLGRVTLTTGGQDRVYENAKEISGASTDADGGSTINLFVEPEDIGPDTTFAAELLQPGDTCTGAGGVPGEASFPESGTTALDARDIGGLKVVIVPVTLNNGLTGDASDATLDLSRDAFMTQYPIADIELSVHEPVRINDTLGATDQRAWSRILNAIGNLRAQERPEQDVYYYGFLKPASSFRNFCTRGCISGIAPLNSPRFGGGPAGSAEQRYGMGLGFGDDASVGTFVHEIGHAAGLPHAPCGGVSGADREYPYSGGSIGSWGYDSVERSLKAPREHTDFMGYCDSTWVSDYNYDNLATRQEAINANAFRFSGPERTYRTLLVGGEGSAEWGGERVTTEAPGGEPETALVMSADGDVLEEITVYRTELSHTDGAFVYVEGSFAPGTTLSVQGAESIAMDAPSSVPEAY